MSFLTRSATLGQESGGTILTLNLWDILRFYHFFSVTACFLSSMRCDVGLQEAEY